MGSINRVFLMGNVTRDPELRQTPSGLAVLDLGLAVNERYKNKAGEQVETTCFVDVVVWGRSAEACKQYVAKGAPIMIEGRLQLDRWETNDGQKRSRLRVRADRVQFLARSKAADGEPADANKEPVAAGVGDDEMPF